MGKPQRPKVARTSAELTEICEDTLDSLVSACARFDRDNTREYRQIAANIRNLCRDTRMSHSLLGQLGLKGRRFLTASPPLSSGNKLAECHLVELIMRPKLPSKPAAWRAVLDTAPMEFVPFEDWWTAPVVIQPDGTTFSRDDLVGYVADQDGGVHADPTIDAAFQEMRNEAFSYTDGRTTTDHVDRHAIRQIAHELIKSLRPSYRRSYKISGAYSVIRAPSFTEAGALQPQALVGYHLTEPSAPCPCGSGLAFSDCHASGSLPPAEMSTLDNEFVAPPGAAYARVGFGVKPD